MKNNKVALVLAFKGTNYGMHLQGYATQQILDSWGYNTEIIDYKAKGILNGAPIQRGLLSCDFRRQIGLEKQCFMTLNLLKVLKL